MLTQIFSAGAYLFSTADFFVYPKPQFYLKRCEIENRYCPYHNFLFTFESSLIKYFQNTFKLK